MTPILGQTNLQKISEADFAYQNNHYREAIAAYKNVQKQLLVEQDWPSYLYCQAFIGQSLIYLTDIQVAMDTLQRGIVLYEQRLPHPKELDALEVGYWLKLHYYNGIAALGKVDECMKALQPLLVDAKRKVPNSYQLLASLHMGVGFSLFYHKDFEEAYGYFQKAINLIGQQGTSDKRRAAFCQVMLGRCRMQAGRFQEALDEIKKLEALTQTDRSVLTPRVQASMCSDYGYIYRSLGNYHRAMEYYRQAADTYLHFYGQKNTYYIATLSSIGDLYKLRQQYDEALRHYEKGVMCMDSVSMAPQWHRAELWKSMAECYAAKSQRHAALQMWEKSMGEAQRLASKAHLAVVKESLGAYYVEQREWGTAWQIFQEAEALLLPHVKSRAADLCRIRNRMVRLLVAQARYKEALDKVQQALVLQTKPGTTLSGWSNPEESRLLLSGEVLHTLAAKADALYAQWKATKNDLSLLLSALQTCEYGIRAGERFRLAFYHDSEESYTWVRQYQGLFNCGTAVALTLYRQTNNADYLERAFAFADQSKAQLLTEGIQLQQHKRQAGVPEILLAQESNLLKEIARMERLLADADEEPTAVTEKAALEDMLFERKKSYEDLMVQMERVSPSYGAYRQKLDLAVSVKSVMETLPNDALLVEYVIDSSYRALHIFTITAEQGLKVQSLPLPFEYSAQLSQLHDLLSSVYLIRPDKKQQYQALARSLYTTFVAPIASQLENKRQLVVINDGPLWHLPFETLLTDDSGNEFYNFPYLLRRFQVQYQYSAALMVHHREQARQMPKDGILVFVPNFEAQPEAISDVGESRSPIDRYYSPLPYAQQEAKAIQQLFGQQESEIMNGPAASEGNFKARLAQPHRIVHIATHSFADLQNPRFSGIVCAQRVRGEEDGIFYASELYGTAVNAQLVVLSSCEGGKGRLDEAEGLLGINRAFVQAGAANILYSLWETKDRATSTFMLEFYKAVRSYKSYGEALQWAKLQMLNREVTALPSLWSGFQLLGNP